jgi:hypothetical protein
MSISTDDVEAIRTMLSALPRHEPKMLTKQQAIATLASEIAAAQRRGYDAGDLAQLLSGKGIDVNGPMLRHYLRKVRKPRSRPSGQAGTKSASARAGESGVDGGGQGTAEPSGPPTSAGKPEASPGINGRSGPRS